LTGLYQHLKEQSSIMLHNEQLTSTNKWLLPMLKIWSRVSQLPGQPGQPGQR